MSLATRSLVAGASRKRNGERAAGAIGALLALASCAATGRPRPDAPADLELVGRSALRVESGRVVPAASGAGFELESPVVRAVVGARPRSEIDVELVYRGPTTEARPLASGELRRQIGVKLRARDTCNVVYVMWHVEPAEGVHVSVKSNPGAHRHDQCRDRGYLQLAPHKHAAVAPLRPGDPHRLRARIDGDRLTVTADDALAWEGALPPEALAFDGPVGIRSDNGVFSARLRVPR